MKIWALLSLIFLINTSSIQKNKFFQGYIAFELEYEDIHEGLDKEYILSYSGDHLMYHHSYQGYLKNYYYREKKISTRWFEAKDNSLRMNQGDSDTLLMYYADETEFEFTISKTDITENILGYNCIKYEVLLEPKSGSTAPMVSYDYYMAEDLIIDIKGYENYVEGGYYELLKLAPNINLKSTYYGEYFTQTRIAKKITPAKVNIENLFPKKQLILKKV